MPCSVWFLAAQSVTGQRFKTKKRRKKDQKVSPIYILLDLSVKSKLEYIGLGLDVRFNIVRAALSICERNGLLCAPDVYIYLQPRQI